MPSGTGESKREATVDPGVVRAIGHPLRMRLLNRLNEEVCSPVEMARELGESVQLISYHVRILRDLGFVELVGTTPRRGAIEHHYRAVRRPVFSDADWAALPANARAALGWEIAKEAFVHARDTFQSGALDDRTDTHLSFSDLTLDEQGWSDMADCLAVVLEQTSEIEERARKRLDAGAEPVKARLAMLLYPTTAPVDDEPVPAPVEAPRRSRKTKKRT
jgi:DNA-binding transcriptional ArsR family regulator